MAIIKKGSTPTILIAKDVRVQKFSNVIFTFQDSVKKQVQKQAIKFEEDIFYINFTQQEIIDFASGVVTCEAQYIFDDKSEMTFRNTFTISDSLTYQSVDGSGNEEIVNASEPLTLNLVNTIVETSGSVEGGSVVTTNGIKQTTWESNTKQDAFSIGENLEMTADKTLNVKTTNDAEKDNTLPITSAGVFTTVGNIKALLETI